MIKFIIVVFSYLLSLSATTGQVVQNGQCSEINVTTVDFDVDDLEGSWFEVLRTPNEYQGGDCSTLEFNRNSNESDTTITMSNIAYNSNFREETIGLLTQNGPGRLLLNTAISSDPVEILVLLFVPNIIAMGYHCVNINANERSVYIWTMGKNPEHNELQEGLINSTINPIGLTISQLQQIDHSEQACYALPELDAGASIILPGSCNLNISVEPNFNVERFAGEWHQIYSYYSDNVVGTCGRAEYTLSGNVVNVLNSEVINQTLRTISGVATSISEVGDGKLSVTLEILPGINATQELWVLSTDYDNYAVLYSCENLPGDQKRVYSWINGRSSNLSASAQAAVDATVNSLVELNYRYYAETQRSDDDCFYYPEVVPNQMVIFRGQCDMNVEVVQNFNASRYLGVWYNIESYPSTFQTGSCNTALYSFNAADGLVEVYNTQVINQRLDFAHGVGVPDPSGAAKLVVSFPIAGTNLTQTTDYWVLDTDYDSYSFVYTCQNLQNNRRAVLSWKLGREKQISAVANTTINNIMNSNPILDQRYYEQDDQTEQACFFYPEPDRNLPVVFPGQCDDTISVVSNFNLTQFAGIWHEIETYPKDQETGECINHDYTSTDNSLTLQSSSIINQFLSLTTANVTFASSDGSAKLNVALNTGEIIPFWILNTDYNDYALGYSCVNRNSTFRAVYSWKLSRNKQLSAAASQAISNAMSSVEVLSDDYFVNVDQSDDACFYLPDLPPGEPIIIVGQCDENIPVVQNFDAARYLGRWRMIESYPSDFQDGTCNDADYSLSGDVVIVYNTQVINQTLNTIIGNATFVNGTGTAKLEVWFPGASESSNYWVLATDYDTYSLVYSCRNIDNERRRVWSWKLSRTDELTPNATNAINQVISTVNVLNSQYYQTIDQSDTACFYFPEANGQPLIFRGQCDENVTVVNNFQAANYLGVWYNIESYPSIFQTGTCNTALYTLNTVANVVEVYNTQVVNQTLDFAHGVGVLDSSGNAKLEVTFPIAGTNLSQTTNYWVLATDYSSYSLVYTCQNLEDNRRAVLSWKLGRQKGLTAQANTAINTAINNVQVLEQRYYEQDDQSEDGCFYFPEPDPVQPPEFPGQCDDSIQAVANFSLSQFGGTWYEVETYPQGPQAGQCINNQFSADEENNVFSLQTSSIRDETLSTMTGNLTFSTNDGSAKLNLALSTGDTIPFWILSTDYNDYALAYSCVNRNATFRVVYSWKLSRSKQLSTTATQAITNAISPIDVLNENYYVNINQSDDACFYLPDLAPGEPVTFFGQCDEDIPVVQNFDAARYLGRWRMIESYSSDFQDGTCNDAQYSLSGDVVIVYNTQVINQTLDTITGNATFASTSDVAKLEVFFPGANESSNYWVLDTDYETYSLVYSCRNLNSERRRVWSWKLSRTNELTLNASNAINQVIDTVNVLNSQYYQTIDQTDSACFYYPESNGQPVIFRGQCDETIPVVTNFAAERYMGLWYDIESYPQFFQNGTCPTANYTLTPTEVTVYNTQVVAQRLDTITGFAVIASQDGSAKLEVTFPENSNSSSPYWVLETDYDNYALVYSCSNIDSERRMVSSWKLSRETTLSSTAVDVINNVTSTIPVLRQQYYVLKGHTEENCLYYPENFGGPVILDGQCNSNQTVVNNLNSALFSGTWYEVSRFPSELQTGECVLNSIDINGNSVTITQTMVNNEQLVTVTGTGTLDSNGQGIITATLSSATGVRQMTLYILATDYSDYALLFSCRDININEKQVYSWKLSRNRSGLSDASNSAIDEIVTSNVDLFEDYYEDTSRSDLACFYYPVLDNPTSIILPGPCSIHNVQGKANFLLNDYLGRWFEISRYPQPSLVGQCSQAEYSLNNTVITVSNNNVNNATLSAITGTASFNSTDGSGVFTVTNILENGEISTANYFVLETDYTGYALVYSCRDLGTQSQVFSWKLSRNRALSNQANAAINNVIINTRGLSEDYYNPTSQSDDDCFYVPELNPTQAPIFRGQCSNIPGVQNFDASRYAGWWHEIERYPNDNDVGECISSRYQQSGNQYLVEDKNVVGTTARIDTSTVQISTDGRITKTLSNGNVVEIWVLATDYDNYALLYSCETIDDEYIRVWSAKHSRVRQLSQASIEAINQVLPTYRYLQSDFYIQVNQSAEACFYYPEPTGEPVRLPGQCDSSIPTQQNFSVVEYTGTWYQIEKYPQIHESGTCIGARYTLNADTSVVDVLNWEVVDGVLETTEGTATVVSEDGSAVLSVTLPITGSNGTTTMELRVLQTDYLTYSLVYSCNNVDEYERTIGVWKLSRTRSMPSTGTAAIDNYMAQREELDQRYFLQTDQNSDCPDPSSGVIIKSSIIIVFICALLQHIV